MISTIGSTIRSHASKWSAPIFLLCLAGLSFTPLLPWLGFYWDDWPSIWFLHNLGPAGFRQVFASDRPFLGYLFTLTTWLVGERMLSWQIFALLARWLAGLAFWRLLLALWPARRRQALWAAALFIVYPGFSQQPIAVTYSHAWLILAIFLTSLTTFVQALRQPERARARLLLSLILAALAMFSTEYFYTLELVRPALAWIVLGESGAQPSRRLRRALTYWLPFLALMLAFFIWRVFIHEFPRNELSEPGQALANPAGMLARIGEDVLEAGWLAWVAPLGALRALDFRQAATLGFLLLALLTGVFTFWYLRRINPTQAAEQGTQAWVKGALPLGIFALLIAGGPFWATDLPIRLDFPNDRFTLAFILGSSLTLVALLELIPRWYGAKSAALAVLIGLAANQHLHTANRYRMEWNLQKEFFWQLSWRAPTIKVGTTLMTARLPFDYFSDNSLTAPLNWIYVAAPDPENLPYLVYDIQARRGNRLLNLAAGQPIEHVYRAMRFSGSTSQALALVFTPPACLKVLDPRHDANYPNLPGRIELALPLSDPAHIQPGEQAKLPREIFGDPPMPGWCTYFEQAELARQVGDWEGVARLADQAMEVDTRLYPVNAPELTPYIEAYAYTGAWEKAVQLTRLARQTAPNVKSMLCETWMRIAADTAPTAERDAALEEVDALLACRW